jgi:hypothetical protein
MTLKCLAKFLGLSSVCYELKATLTLKSLLRAALKAIFPTGRASSSGVFDSDVWVRTIMSETAKVKHDVLTVSTMATALVTALGANLELNGLQNLSNQLSRAR